MFLYRSTATRVNSIYFWFSIFCLISLFGKGLCSNELLRLMRQRQICAPIPAASEKGAAAGVGGGGEFFFNFFCSRLIGGDFFSVVFLLLSRFFSLFFFLVGPRLSPSKLPILHATNLNRLASIYTPLSLSLSPPSLHVLRPKRRAPTGRHDQVNQLLSH